MSRLKSNTNKNALRRPKRTNPKERSVCHHFLSFSNQKHIHLLQGKAKAIESSSDDSMLMDVNAGANSNFDDINSDEPKPAKGKAAAAGTTKAKKALAKGRGKKVAVVCTSTLFLVCDS